MNRHDLSQHIVLYLFRFHGKVCEVIIKMPETIKITYTPLINAMASCMYIQACLEPDVPIDQRTKRMEMAEQVRTNWYSTLRESIGDSI